MRPCVLSKITMSWKDHKEIKIEIEKNEPFKCLLLLYLTFYSRFFVVLHLCQALGLRINHSVPSCLRPQFQAAVTSLSVGDFPNGKRDVLWWIFGLLKKMGEIHSESNPSLNLPKSSKVFWFFWGILSRKTHIISSELFSALHFCKTCPSNISFLSFVKPVVFLSPASIGRPLLPSAFEAAASSLCDWRNPEWRKRTKAVRVGW